VKYSNGEQEKKSGQTKTIKKGAHKRTIVNIQRKQEQFDTTSDFKYDFT
jgi:hypothetical protein